MPSYVVSSESPINVRAVERPDVPERPEGWPPAGGIGRPPGRPEPEPPEILPPLPPEGELPYPPTPEHPWVPVDPTLPPLPPGVIWPPNIDLPDMTGKSLVLGLFYVSRHAPKWGWVVVDHEKTKEAIKEAIQKVKDRLPAGGVGGRPPARPTPG